MSSEIVENVRIDDEAYEVPTYDEAFPPMAAGAGDSQTRSGGVSPSVGNWTTKMSVRSSTVTQVFAVPLEERKYKEMSQQNFGEKGGEQAKICQDIINKFGVHIEMSLARDKSLTVVITGKTDTVMQARKMVVQHLQTQASVQLRIPREHHKYIIGTKGKKLSELELKSATKITVPRSQENSDYITIIGTKEGIEAVRHEIQLISDEQAKLAFERLAVERIYHPFICGANNQLLNELMNRTGAKIHVPPLSADKDELVVSGEKEGVQQAVQHIMKVYEEKRRYCQTVSVEVRKSQHKYVIGTKGTALAEILATTGVSVEVPPSDSGLETITLRGEQDKLGPALTMVYSKANSVVLEEVTAPEWLHRFIIGKRGVNINRIMDDYPKVHIEFTQGSERIVIEGPPEEVSRVRVLLEQMTQDLSSRMAFAEIEVDQKYHRHIIGKGGANVNRIKDDTNVSIKIPSDSDPSNIIRLEGSPQGVAQAKKELLDMVHKLENEKTRDILIEQRFHKTLIGQAGAQIKEIRDRFNQVQITFPDAGRKSDVVQLRGPKADVDKCYKYLQKTQADLQLNNYLAQVHIFKQFHRNIIGKGGANIRTIRDETDTKIDLPSEASDSDVISITGKKENVEKAKQRIEDIQKELANIKDISIDIPHAFHNAIIGAKGRLIRAVSEECGGVIIRFPPSGSTSDKVTIRGPTNDVENARKQLLELAQQRQEASHSAEVRAKPEYHKFLIGRNGANIRKVRERTGARVAFPVAGDADQEVIVIMGRKDDVAKARAELEALVADLDKVVEDEVNIDPKYHRHFVARRGEILRQVGDDYGGVTVSFPRSGVKSDRVVIKGAKDCVHGAKKRLLEIVDDLEQQVTIECVIEQKYHRTVMGARGSKVQEITKQYDVNVKFPDKPANADEQNGDAQPQLNGDVNGDVPRKCDVITIQGKRDNCEAARQALQDLVPVTESVDIPFEFHRDIIGQKGRNIRRLMDDFDVNISVPPSNERSESVKVHGSPANVARALEGLRDKLGELEAEKEQRQLKSFKLVLEVDPKYHPKIIGRRGAIISKIRDDFDVNVQFPEKGAENVSEISITGFEEQAELAKKEIERIVADLEQRVTVSVSIDHRVFPRLIGPKGRAIRQVMDKFAVDIRFPADNAQDKDAVEVNGMEQDVEDCREYLLNLEEEYMQDINDRAMLEQYQKPARSEQQERPRPQAPFQVRGAPWHQAPDVSSSSDFPELGARRPASTAARWGPAVKR